MGDQEPGRNIKPAQQVALPIKLENKRTVLIRKKECTVWSDSNPFRIKSERRPFVIQVERAGGSNKSLPVFVLEESCVEQRHLDVWKRSTYFRCDVQEMKSVEVWHIGHTVEGPPIRRGNEDIVVSGIAYIRTETAESLLGNAARWICSIADIAFE